MIEIAEREAASRVRDGLRALRAARYDEALELLDGCAEWPEPIAAEAALARADALARRRPAEALAWLAAVGDLFTGELRFSYELALGKTFAAVRDVESAETHYDVAAALAGSVAHGEETLAYHRARLLWMTQRYDPLAPDVARAVTHPDPNVAAAAYAVRAWHHGSLGDFRAQIADFVRALRYAAAGPTPVDVATLAVTCHSLARVAFEIADGDGVAAAREAFDAIAWSDGIAVDRFQTLRALGWDAFMRGRSGEAQWTFKEARDGAPSVAWRVTAHLDRAFVARIAGNDAWSFEELSAADRLAHDVRWESTFGEERLALVSLATLYAALDAPRAQRYAATWSRLGTENVDPTLALASDPRAKGFARLAQGRIDQMLGRRDAARASLVRAYETFERIGYRFQAALAATALEELTGETGWHERAVAHAGAYPDCPLLAVVEAVPRKPAFPAGLTPLQEQLARAVAAGADAAELSQRFSRSRYTVDRQIETLCVAFGAASAVELRALVRERL